eukprot:Seg503.18 transcript_id=Seg503.18/GoldUCD/mRNA.D3Y31 product="hypothetical protein" protein_id=Seg503.18/GoldUCD/D3Y31
MKLIVFVILGFACLLNGELIAEDDAEQLSEPRIGSENFESDADSIDREIEAEDELNPMEDDVDHDIEDATEKQKDPGVFTAISYYCNYCKIAERCRRSFRSCTSSFLRKSQRLCKYCKPSTYLNLVRRIRIRLPRIRLPRIRVPRIRVPRIRWGRRRRSWGRRRRGWG